MNAANKKKLRANLVKARAALAAKRKAGWKPKPRKQVKAAPTARVSALKKALEQEAVALEERAKKLRAAAELL
jgi:phage gp16-like protein